FSKRARRAAGPDPTRPDDRPRLDPCAGSDAAAALDDYMLADDRHHADERVVVDLTRAHPHIVSEGDALADDEVAAGAIGEKQRVVLNIAARPQHDACIAGIEHATEIDAGVIGERYVTDECRCRRHVRATNPRRAAGTRIQRTPATVRRHQ